MLAPDARWSLSASWLLLVLVVGISVGSPSVGITVLLAVGAIVPPLMMLALWKKKPVLTVAEVVRNVENRS